MNKLIFIVIVYLLSVPGSLFATAKKDYRVFKDSVLLDKFACEDADTVLFGNGIRTSYEGARESLEELQIEVDKK